MWKHTLNRAKRFFHDCLQAFSTEKTLKHHIEGYFKINDQQMIVMSKKPVR